jgi:hypothetical protein
MDHPYPLHARRFGASIHPRVVAAERQKIERMLDTIPSMCGHPDEQVNLSSGAWRIGSHNCPPARARAMLDFARARASESGGTTGAAVLLDQATGRY